MSIFKSLKWFKSQKEKDLEDLEIAKRKLELDILKSQQEGIESFKNTPIQVIEEKPYMNIKLVNDVLTIILKDGNIISKTNGTQEDFKKARAASTEEELFKIASSTQGLEEKRQKEAEIAKNKALIEGIDNLRDLEDFEVIDGSVYIKGVNGEVINRSMPQLLVERFIIIKDKYQYNSDKRVVDISEYQALKKFWLKCCLNPNAQSAEDLYQFLSKHQFKIDKHGNFYAYRRVVSREDVRKELVEFVSNTYNKVKGIWKKNARDYYVYKNDEGFTFSKKNDDPENVIGNLHDLYVDLPNLQEKTYTSKHTGMEDYRVGEVISMPRDNGDDNNQISCSKGFHAANKAYDYSGFGDTPILIIINPVDVLAVPKNEIGKLRTCRWFFAMVLSEEEKYILDDDDFDTMELGDIFEEKCSVDLQNYVQNSFAEEVRRHTFTIPQISASEINNIVNSLEDMRKAISDRIVEFD